ncbi:AMP-binding protein [Streptomyces sp. GKU 257-1]|nr:AMP-binding protein [Streptomyces sp. GKU 257-1]
MPSSAGPEQHPAASGFEVVLDLSAFSAGSHSASPSVSAAPAARAGADSTADAGLPGDCVLRVAVLPERDGLRLRLLGRGDVLDGPYAERVGGYLLTALAMMTADATAEHHAQSLLSAGELAQQIDGLAGPLRAVPDRRMHELFEERVREHPDRVAAVHDGTEWSYDALNRRANRIAHALLDRGLRPEDVVAVVTERNLSWMAAVLGVFKAGGVYLPVEPNFPADRIAAMLGRSACRFVLTEPGSTATLDQVPADPGTRGASGEPAPDVEVPKRLYLADVLVEEGEGADTDPGVPVAAGQTRVHLLHLRFDGRAEGRDVRARRHAQPSPRQDRGSGDRCRTGGRPDRAAVLRHLPVAARERAAGGGPHAGRRAARGPRHRAVRRSAGRRRGGSAAGGPLLPGGDAHLGGGEATRTRPPAGRLRDRGGAEEGAGRALVRGLPRHRTGERLRTDRDVGRHQPRGHGPGARPRPGAPRPRGAQRAGLRRRRAARPGPARGAGGEIVFSGVCVGRGYINDPVRTAAAFGTDPHRPGERLYRSGDIGRWLPDGALEFLGRRDSQTKIRGFRIEIGEIENHLLRVPGVRDSAVVVVEGTDGERHLAAFYAADLPLSVDEVRAGPRRCPARVHGAADLPPPGGSAAHRQRQDRQEGAGPGGGRGRVPHRGARRAPGGDTAPRTATERRLAEQWSRVLNIPVAEISRGQHFFESGGTSLSAVRLGVESGGTASLEDIVNNPVLAELARVMDEHPQQGKGQSA